MTHILDDDLQLRAVENDIFKGECLIGRIAALAAISSARGRTRQAGQARKALRLAAELLEPLYIIRERLRDPVRNRSAG